MSVNPTSLEPLLNGWEDSGGRCDDDRGVGSELMPQATKKTADRNCRSVRQRFSVGVSARRLGGKGGSVKEQRSAKPDWSASEGCQGEAATQVGAFRPGSATLAPSGPTRETPLTTLGHQAFQVYLGSASSDP